jgi:hypothetical protein
MSCFVGWFILRRCWDSVNEVSVFWWFSSSSFVSVVNFSHLSLPRIDDRAFLLLAFSGELAE